MKCLSSWPYYCEMLVASVKVASEVAVLALYSKSEGCAKHVRAPPLSEAVKGVEESYSIFLQAMVNICSEV